MARSTINRSTGWQRADAERTAALTRLANAAERQADLLATTLAQFTSATTTTVDDSPPLPQERVGDGPCSDCGRGNAVPWFATNDVWNNVMGGRDARDDPGGLLCPTCFLLRADEVMPGRVWHLAPEDATPSHVSVPRPQIHTGPKGMAPDEAAAHYLRDAAIRVREQRYWGSGVTALVSDLLDQVAAAVDATRRRAPDEEAGP